MGWDFELYLEQGVSGIIPFGNRPCESQILTRVAQPQINYVLVYAQIV